MKHIASPILIEEAIFHEQIIRLVAPYPPTDPIDRFDTCHARDTRLYGVPWRPEHAR